MVYYQRRCKRGNHSALAMHEPRPPILSLALIRALCSCPPPGPPSIPRCRAPKGGKGIAKSHAPPPTEHDERSMFNPEFHRENADDYDNPSCLAFEVLTAAEEERDAYFHLGHLSPEPWLE